MLNIFRGKKPLPNYRLGSPSDGELQTITVYEEVGLCWLIPCVGCLIDATDVEDTALRFRRRVAEHHLYPGKI